MSLVVDVGANNGKWGLEYARRNPEVRVVAFEPTPRLVAGIRATSPPSNYTIVQAAVSDVEGVAAFHLTPGEGGCSSLLPLRPKEELEKVWVNRPDIVEESVIEVPVVRLDRYLSENGWAEDTKIGFLHVDAQGTDLKVLAGLGDRLRYVDGGEVEAVIKPEESIYAGQQTTVEACCDFLRAAGFRFAVLPHLNFLEADIRFWRLR